jgi:hypothetical protein
MGLAGVFRKFILQLWNRHAMAESLWPKQLSHLGTSDEVWDERLEIERSKWGFDVLQNDPPLVDMKCLAAGKQENSTVQPQ